MKPEFNPKEVLGHEGNAMELLKESVESKLQLEVFGDMKKAAREIKAKAEETLPALLNLDLDDVYRQTRAFDASQRSAPAPGAADEFESPQALVLDFQMDLPAATITGNPERGITARKTYNSGRVETDSIGPNGFRSEWIQADGTTTETFIFDPYGMRSESRTSEGEDKSFIPGPRTGIEDGAVAARALGEELARAWDEAGQAQVDGED